ncbi:MAG: hypothetical protein IKN90_01360 [Treponema sp.]|nr:hypothetical protein [Treponema sp.]
MKKIIMALLVAAALAVSSFAQSTSSSGTPIWDHGDNVSEFSYRNVGVYRIFDQADSYIVLYEKQSLEIGKVVIPKAWFKTSAPRKLDFRHKPAGMGTYMTVLYKNGEFYKVFLTVNPKRSDPVWAVADPHARMEITNADSLDIEF